MSLYNLVIELYYTAAVLDLSFAAHHQSSHFGGGQLPVLLGVPRYLHRVASRRVEFLQLLPAVTYCATPAPGYFASTYKTVPSPGFIACLLSEFFTGYQDGLSTRRATLSYFV